MPKLGKSHCIDTFPTVIFSGGKRQREVGNDSMSV